MNKLIYPTVALFISAIAPAGQAAGMSYNYIEGAVNHSEDDDTDHNAELQGSIALDTGVNLRLGYSESSLNDESESYSQYSAAIGLHGPSFHRADLVIEAGVLYGIYDAPDSSNDLTEKGFSIAAGYRKQFNDRLEADIMISHHFLGDFSETALKTGGRFHLTDNISAGVNYTITDNEDFWRSSIRLGTL